MRVAVISDIHGNVHALEASLAALEGERPDAIWCLGDLIGYGPRPNECCLRVQEVADVCLVGNHDLGVLDRISLDDFSYEAAASAFWTRGVLNESSRDYLDDLSPGAEIPDAGAELYHASPRDPVWEYVLDAGSMRAALEDTVQPVIMVGHSHVPLLARLDGDQLHAAHAPEGTEVDLAAGRVLMNPGSVGQPRDGDPRAAFLVLDLDERRAWFRRVEYDVEQTQEEIRAEEDLPAALAERLAHGI
jgi:diadenosine tetraphosphatase ApaH/serine/threonine PP2A family protein phosphatase